MILGGVKRATVGYSSPDRQRGALELSCVVVQDCGALMNGDLIEACQPAGRVSTPVWTDGRDSHLSQGKQEGYWHLKDRLGHCWVGYRETALHKIVKLIVSVMPQRPQG